MAVAPCAPRPVVLSAWRVAGSGFPQEKVPVGGAVADPAAVRATINEDLPATRVLFDRLAQVPGVTTGDVSLSVYSAGIRPLAWAGRIHMHAGDLAGLADRLEKDGPFAAIVVAGDNAAENAETALAIRPWTARRPAFAAPIYVEDGAPGLARRAYIRYDGIRPRPDQGFLSTLPGSSDAAAAIEPFGMLEELRAPDFLSGAREQRAALLHEAYRQKRLDALHEDIDSGRSELPDWNDLDETYRQANRRAVDFLPVLRIAAGIERWWEPSGEQLKSALARDPQLMETLARMVHESWRADRELEGWRQGDIRDASRRLHTDLVDYDALTDEKKELDREQIRLLAELERSPEDRQA